MQSTIYKYFFYIKILITIIISNSQDHVISPILIDFDGSTDELDSKFNTQVFLLYTYKILIIIIIILNSQDHACYPPRFWSILMDRWTNYILSNSNICNRVFTSKIFVIIIISKITWSPRFWSILMDLWTNYILSNSIRKYSFYILIRYL